MAGQVYFEDVEEGMELPPAVKNASRTQLFLFSAATSNPHRIHYDRDYAASEGHPDILIHGPLQGAWLSQYVTSWIGPAGRMLNLSWQNRGRAFPEQDHTFKGKVIAKRTNEQGNIVELTVWEENPKGEILMPGSATVSLPSRT